MTDSRWGKCRVAVACAAFAGLVLLCIGAVVGLLAWRSATPVRPAAPLPNDVYVWQRKWTPAVSDAVRQTGSLAHAWHVLAAEYERAPNGTYQWTAASPDWRALAQTQAQTSARAPLIAVFRIDGHITAWDDATLATQIGARVRDWQARGLMVSGVEVDYDCATARLDDYRRFLRVLRSVLDADLRLSITALPTWLESASLDALLAACDDVVLQLHAVLDPARGLFDAARARDWIDQFARRAPCPWRVALPAYGTRVTWDDTGRVAAIESERPVLYPAGTSHELVAAPQAMLAFATQMDRAPPRGLVGIAWFRLPTSADARAWSLTTWRAVLGRQPLEPKVEAIATPADSPGHSPGLYDVRLVSAGTADAMLPATVRVITACVAADGINGYALDRATQGTVLRRVQSGLLRVGEQIDIGWLRCNGPPLFKVSG